MKIKGAVLLKLEYMSFCLSVWCLYEDKGWCLIQAGIHIILPVRVVYVAI